MAWKHTFFGLLAIVGLALSIPLAVSAEESSYDAYNITLQPGGTEGELNFTWFTTTEPTENTELILYDTSNVATYYAAICDIVDVEEQASGPSGPPPSGDFTVSTVSADTEDDSEAAEEEATIYSCKVTDVRVEAGSQYAYVVGDGTNYSESVSFETKDAQSYNFIFVGDPQIGASRDTESDSAGWGETVTAALTAFPDSSFIFSAGDQVESSTSSSQYDGFFSAEEFTSVPFVPTIGNHDTSELYAYHFNIPNESEEYGVTENVGGDYWFTHGNALFMVLNSNNSSATSHDAFMTEAIAANPDVTWKIVVFHHSIYSSARHVSDVNDLRIAMYPVLDAQDIDVVLSGHDHFYARTYHLSGGAVAEDAAAYADDVALTGDVAEKVKKVIGKAVPVDPIGTVYFTANSASGSKYYDYSYIEGYTNLYFAQYAQLDTPTYMNVEVSSTALTVSAYRTDTGEQVDTYTIAKKRTGRHSYE